MKRFLWAVLMTSWISGFTDESVEASAESCSQKVFKCTPPLWEVKGSYFFFASSVMRDIYGSGGFEVQMSGSYPICRGLQIYGSVGFLEAWGQSQNFHQDTSIWQIPVDLGLKPVITIASFAEYYLAVGPRYFYVHQHNDSNYVNKNTSRNGAGLFVNTGFNFFPIPHLLVDVFAEYAYEPTNFSSDIRNVYGGDVQVSLFNFGAGIGYAF